MITLLLLLGFAPHHALILGVACYAGIYRLTGAW